MICFDSCDDSFQVFYVEDKGWWVRNPKFDGTLAAFSSGPFGTEGQAREHADQCNRERGAQAEHRAELAVDVGQGLNAA